MGMSDNTKEFIFNLRSTADTSGVKEMGKELEVLGGDKLDKLEGELEGSFARLREKLDGAGKEAAQMGEEVAKAGATGAGGIENLAGKLGMIAGVVTTGVAAAKIFWDAWSSRAPGAADSIGRAFGALQGSIGDVIAGLGPSEGAVKSWADKWVLALGGVTKEMEGWTNTEEQLQAKVAADVKAKSDAVVKELEAQTEAYRKLKEQIIDAYEAQQKQSGRASQAQDLADASERRQIQGNPNLSAEDKRMMNEDLDTRIRERKAQEKQDALAAEAKREADLVNAARAEKEAADSGVSDQAAKVQELKQREAAKSKAELAAQELARQEEEYQAAVGAAAAGNQGGGFVMPAVPQTLVDARDRAARLAEEAQSKAAESPGSLRDETAKLEQLKAQQKKADAEAEQAERRWGKASTDIGERSNLETMKAEDQRQQAEDARWERMRKESTAPADTGADQAVVDGADKAAAAATTGSDQSAQAMTRLAESIAQAFAKQEAAIRSATDAASAAASAAERAANSAAEAARNATNAGRGRRYQ